MGYETAIYVIEEYAYTAEESMGGFADRSGSVITSIDLSVIGYDSKAYSVLSDARQAYTALRATGDRLANLPHNFYLTGGDLMFLKEDEYPEDLTAVIRPMDPYNEHISPVDLDTLIEALEQDQKETPYRRAALALAVLNQFAGGGWDLNRISVWQFGH